MNYSDDVKNEILSRLKGMSETITNSFGELSKGKPIFVSELVQQNRLNICKSCNKYNEQTTQCQLCGCFMSAKTKLIHGKCPIDKWNQEL